MIAINQLDRQFQSLKKEFLSAMERVIDSGHFIVGHEVKRFEEEVCHYLDIEYAVSVGNGTDALILALHALNIGEGDEVITTPFTFFATAEAISRVGAIPVFVDIDPTTYNLNVNLIEEKVTSKTKAIIPVHLFGQGCEMKKIQEIAKEYQLFIIEDACQAFGIELGDKKLGTIGDIGCFSFFPTKNLSTIGDGGLVVTKNKKIAERIKKLRHHGSEKKYHHSEVGYNSRLDEIHAAFLRICLGKIDEWNQRRNVLAQRYQCLKELKGVKIPNGVTNLSHGYHLYCIEHSKRNELKEFLDDKGIGCGIYYPVPLHLQSVYRILGYHVGDFPRAEEAAKVILAIPLHPFMTDNEQDEVIRVLQEFK
ncbi:DegT/DnrJ/EryC1/StrS family aminotransferase [Alkalihalobacillus sp. 1P02AB]|uniref:DegT/DnrJ/EryC1/StrS family aminotransferase n=1 Tax=Alkalihalobacillus sp. 1P02AB TaxID=3132260 RepID=UPI0039A48C3B